MKSDSYIDNLLEYFKQNDPFKSVRKSKLAELVSLPLLPDEYSDLAMEVKKLHRTITNNQAAFGIPLITIEEKK